MATQKENSTIVYFHTGRGGRFNNSGYRTFNGNKNIAEVLSLADNSGQWSFIKDRDEKGRFCTPYYVNSNGREMISVKEVETGVGTLNWDNEYDSDCCMYLRDCDENDLLLIAKSQEWNKEYLIQEFFNDCSEVEIDWSKFNGNYEGLITDYFNFVFDVEEFYTEEKTEE